MATPEIVQLDALPPFACPCGTARRAFAGNPDSPASVHLVEIKHDAAIHYHKHMTETYVVIAGEGWIELDGQRHPLRPLSTVRIPPGCRHRAIGPLTLINIATPAFDPADEYLD